MSLVFIFPGGRFRLEAEETVDDSDKTFTVPSTKRWKIISIYVEFTSTATVGNRLMRVDITDSANDIIYRVQPGWTQPANETITYTFMPGYSVRDSDPGTGGYCCFPLPELILDAGYKIRVWDGTAVDAAADDMIIQMMLLELDI